MKPLLLKGHERPLTHLHYNREGDLLFSCAKDHKPCVWYANTGMRLGTFNGHKGTVWHCDTNWDSSLFLTGAADNTAKLWELETGKELFNFQHKSAVRAVGFATGDNMILTVCDKAMGQDPTIFIYKLHDDMSQMVDEPISAFKGHSLKINRAFWSPLNDKIYSASDDGSVRVWDAETGTELLKAHDHSKGINNMSFSSDRGMFVTASKDTTAKLYDSRTLQCFKTYQSNVPINAAVMSPNRPHIVLGGGQEAMNVTTTHTRSGKFESHFYHLVYEDLLGSVSGHFGPINTIGFNPDGNSFTSGAEDGYVRLHHFDADYYETKTDF